MAEQEKQAQEKRKACANCSKQMKRIAWYYRNGKYFCGNACASTFLKKLQEEKKLKDEQKRKEEETKAKEQSPVAPPPVATEETAQPQPKEKEDSGDTKQP